MKKYSFKKKNFKIQKKQKIKKKYFIKEKDYNDSIAFIAFNTISKS